MTITVDDTSVHQPSLPLGMITPTTKISDDLSHRLQRLDAYNLTFVAERLVRKSILSPEEVDNALVEFKRFMALVLVGHRELPMISPQVDEVWHTLILFTREYARFCHTIFGEFVHHVPTGGDAQDGIAARAKFLAIYTQHFGYLPAHFYPEWSLSSLHGALECKPNGEGCWSCHTHECTVH